ncbi:hypothetical protein R6Q57_022805 [Mikania cordata]
MEELMDPETAFLASKEETGNEWELFKENVRPLKRGRHVKLLNDSLKSNSDIRIRSSLKETRRKLIKSINEYEGEDPIQPWLDCIKWVQDAFPPGGDCSGLVVIIEQCVCTFWHDERYKNDLRYLKVWLEYAQSCNDAEVVLSFLDANKIGHTHSLFYISYANHLELKNKIKTANEIYECGISRNAQPIEKLKAAYKKFFARSMSRPKPSEETAVRNVVLILLEKNQSKKGESKLLKLAKTSLSSSNGSEASLKPSTWSTLGARAERNKENNAIPSKWTSNKIPQRAFRRAAPPPPCIEIFVDDEGSSESHIVSNGDGNVQLRDNNDGKGLKKCRFHMLKVSDGSSTRLHIGFRLKHDQGVSNSSVCVMKM